MSQNTVERELLSNWKLKSTDNVEDWMPATVPGCVHTDLLKNKHILDPFYRLNEKEVQWIDKKDWVYETVFTLPLEIRNKKTIILNFKGLDTYAKVFLNNNEILISDNMFREWNVDCSSYLNKYGDNFMRVEFQSPINKTLPLYDAQIYHLPAPNDQSNVGGLGDKKLSVLTRKAGYMYGWDWGPRLVTMGIWRPITIIGYDNFRISEFQLNTNSLTDTLADVTASIKVNSLETIRATVEFSTDEAVIHTEDAIFDRSKNAIVCNFSINNPKLWWCNGMGKSNMYNFYCTIKQGNSVLDKKKIRTGIRTIELVHEKDNEGKSFYFKLNGVPVFMKGANYIPQDNFPSRVTKEKYSKTIHDVVDANMNMLRVWGGGVYENDIFYDLCDENGILIWQDFMFACSLYPGDKIFIDNVRQEISDNVKRLRNHPCIALWCGNNEIHTAWNDWGWKTEINSKSTELAGKIYSDYELLFHKTIPQVLKETDPSRPYRPSSPMASYDQKAGDLNSGDMHYWDVWHFEKPFSEYETNVGRFMSEYGFQSFPELRTVEQYTKPLDRDIESEVMLAHQRHPRGNQLIKKYMGMYYRKPETFEGMLYVGQVLQAEGIKRAIEAHRSARPHCMGTLYWQLNDCWPVASWSGIDYYGRWKALHYFVKKAFNPISLITRVQDKKINISLVNDKLSPFSVDLKIRLISFNGIELWNSIKHVEINTNTVTKVFTVIPDSVLDENYKHETFLIINALNDSTIPNSITYFDEVKNLNLPKPNIKSTITASDMGYKIELSTDKLAKNVYLQTGKNGFFSDNYFDLLPGETREIFFKTQSKIFDSNTLKIFSIVDTY